MLEDSLARHLGPDAAAFVAAVFSLHDTAEIGDLVSSAGFEEVEVWSSTTTLRLPSPEDFLWQYVHSTPLAGAAAQLDDQGRSELQSEVVAGWQPFVEDGSLSLELGTTIGTARK